MEDNKGSKKNNAGHQVMFIPHAYHYGFYGNITLPYMNSCALNVDSLVNGLTLNTLPSLSYRTVYRNVETYFFAPPKAGGRHERNLSLQKKGLARI